MYTYIEMCIENATMIYLHEGMAISIDSKHIYAISRYDEIHLVDRSPLTRARRPPKGQGEEESEEQRPES